MLCVYQVLQRVLCNDKLLVLFEPALIVIVSVEVRVSLALPFYAPRNDRQKVALWLFESPDDFDFIRSHELAFVLRIHCLLLLGLFQLLLEQQGFLLFLQLQLLLLLQS